jgi:hypothetical protein
VDHLAPAPPGVKSDEDVPDGFFVDRDPRWLVNEDESEWWVEDSLGLRPQPYDHYRAQTRAEEIFLAAADVLPVLLGQNLSPALRTAALHLQALVGKVQAGELVKAPAPCEPCPPDRHSYRIHVYPVYRVSIEVEAASMADAIDAAEDAVHFPNFHDILGDPRYEDFEWAEDVAWYEIREADSEEPPDKWIRDSLGLRPTSRITFAARHYAGELFHAVSLVLDALAALPRLAGNVADAARRLREVAR